MPHAAVVLRSFHHGCAEWVATRQTACHLVAGVSLVIVHAGVIPIPPIWTASNHGLTPQPRASSIPVAAIVTWPPSHAYSDEAVIEAMVVMDEVIVIVVVAVPILAMPVTAMPVTAMPVTAMPVAAMPAITTHSGNMSATNAATTDVASAPVTSAHVASAHVASAHVASAHVASAHVASTHVASTHVASAHMASAHVASATASTGVCIFDSDWKKQQAAREGSYCRDTHFHDCISWDAKAPSRPPIYELNQ